MTGKIPDIDELIGAETDPQERERLTRLHRTLAGTEPFPELPSSLKRPPVVDGVRRLPLAGRAPGLPRAWRGQRQRRAAFAAAAASVALAGAGGAYLATAPGGTGGDSWRVAMHATPAAPDAAATLLVGSRDHAGNWAVTLSVRDLPRLPASSYYEMLLTRRGRLVGSCGTFRVDTGTTVVHLNVPYKLNESSGWLIRREVSPGRFGPLLLRT